MTFEYSCEVAAAVALAPAAVDTGAVERTEKVAAGRVSCVLTAVEMAGCEDEEEGRNRDEKDVVGGPVVE